MQLINIADVSSAQPAQARAEAVGRESAVTGWLALAGSMLPMAECVTAMDPVEWLTDDIIECMAKRPTTTAVANISRAIVSHAIRLRFRCPVETAGADSINASPTRGFVRE